MVVLSLQVKGSGIMLDPARWAFRARDEGD